MDLVFGPLRYRVVGPLPAFLSRYVSALDESAMPLTWTTEPAPLEAHGVRGAWVAISTASRVIYLPGSADPERALHAPLAELVAADLPSRAALMLHASAVRVNHGAVLLVGPPSVGKTTFARHVPARAFAGNAVCVWRADGRWVCAALPFASDPDERLDASGVLPVEAIVELHRGTSAGFEWLDAPRATVAVMKSVAGPPFNDPSHRHRAVLALDLAAAVRVGSLAVTGGGGDLVVLDQSLNLSAPP